MSSTVLVRYGAIPDVARFQPELDSSVERGSTVVIAGPRGLELGTLLEPIAGAGSEVPETNGKKTNGHGDHETDLRVVRIAGADDLETHRALRQECDAEFETWRQRIAGWNLQLEIIDLERTLDRSKLILYVLNERGPDCTKLALYAAAAGLGTIEVQPVSADGLVRLETGGGGGCGSGGGCGCG
jgi:cell fate regulator YaaT (PSP1 superfamily)